MTLSRDRTLRIWPISEQLSSSLGADPIPEGVHEEVITNIETSLSSQVEMETTFTNVQVKTHCTYTCMHVPSSLPTVALSHAMHS